MIAQLTHRKATIDDVPAIIELLSQDKLGAKREIATTPLDTQYIEAFHRIDQDDNHYLMVVELEGEIVATCHLTLLPSLTFTGTTRLQIEAVRVHPNHRGNAIGEWMIKQAIEYGKSRHATIIQLTTNKERPNAISFYTKLGFASTHEGMKLSL